MSIETMQSQTNQRAKRQCPVSPLCALPTYDKMQILWSANHTPKKMVVHFYVDSSTYYYGRVINCSIFWSCGRLCSNYSS